MKTVLCYGDSNTWGAATEPRPQGRYYPHERWPGILAEAIGSEWLVIEEGLPGRTTVHDDPVEGPGRNGLTYLLPCLESHHPLDVVVVMLGTNDLKARFALAPSDIAEGVGHVIDAVLFVGREDRRVPRVILVCPPPILPELGEAADKFAGGVEKSCRLSPLYQAVAADRGVQFVDAGQIISSSTRDGFHLDRQAHDRLGRAIAEVVLRLTIEGC